MDKEIAKILVEQGKGILNSMKTLQKSAKKKGKKRGDYFENFSANERSFIVNTYRDPSLEQLPEIKSFLKKIDAFSEYFLGVNTDFDKIIDVKLAEKAYQEVLSAYNDMVKALSLESETVITNEF